MSETEAACLKDRLLAIQSEQFKKRSTSSNWLGKTKTGHIQYNVLGFMKKSVKNMFSARLQIAIYRSYLC